MRPTITIIPTPDEHPYRALHPVAQYRHTFREDGVLWSSVAEYCLAQPLVSAADREHILCHAYRCAIEQNLHLRTLLLGTGNATITAGGIDLTLLGFPDAHQASDPIARALMQVRELVAPRAHDPGQVQCHHPAATDTRSLCVHRLEAERIAIRRRFTGRGREFQILCEDCCRALPAAPPLRRVCASCFGAYLTASSNLPDIGMPEFRARSTSLAFEHRVCACVEQQLDWIATVPVPIAPHTWLSLTRDGSLQQLDSRTGAVRKLASLIDSQLDLSKPVVLAVAPRGALVAVAEAFGCKAVVLEPENGRITMRLEREDYHEEHCRFPIGFFELERRLLLVHASRWNRLDVSDPHTGELLTAREDEQSAHHLQYFHAALTISPDGARVVESGWIWTPVAMPRTFSLARWMHDNPWESEDGPSVHELPGCEWVWDVGVAWLDATTVAIWGDGPDFETLTPAVSIYDVETGELKQRFDGPNMGLTVVPPYLLASDPGCGTSVWDPATGQRLLHDATFVPIAAHPDSHELLSCASAGELLVSRLIDNLKTP